MRPTALSPAHLSPAHLSTAAAQATPSLTLVRPGFPLAGLLFACCVFAGLVFTGCVFAGSAHNDSAQHAAPSTGTATVAAVVDGDTVELTFGTITERVRLLGIDAPESVHPTVPVQCFGAEAGAALSELLPTGTEVRVERDVEGRDRYGRLLLHLYRSDDGLFVNGWLVEQGLADTAFYQPNQARYATLSAAKGRAVAAEAGLWGHCDGPDQPLDPDD